MQYEFRPLGDWVGALTPTYARQYSRFKTGYEATIDQLESEVAKLGGKKIVIQVDLSERDIRVDGLPRANARYGSNPGVVVSFDSRYGPLRYATDEFTSWQANLRAIALSLEALRQVDRYGVTKRGEQYTGWKALPAQASTFADAVEAAAWMRDYSVELMPRWLGDPADLRALYLAMAQRMHPDKGGPVADWHRLDEAWRLIKTEGQAT